MSIHTNISEKKYRKLTVQVSLDGFSYAIFDTLNHQVLAVEEVNFNDFSKTNKVEELYWKAFIDNRELTKTYDDVIVIHNNNLNTFVPQALFDDELAGSYLQYHTKVFETDFFTFDAMDNYEMNNVYIPYVNINNYLIDQFGPFDYRHVNSILVSKLLDMSRNVEEKQVFAHFGETHFELVVAQNRKLVLFNSFEYATAADFVYYLLFTAEQLNLNPEHFKLHLLGDISEGSELFRMAYKYVRNVSLLDVSDLQRNNNFSEEKNRKHFILFNS